MHRDRVRFTGWGGHFDIPKAHQEMTPSFAVYSPLVKRPNPIQNTVTHRVQNV
jgi:hypothetical protein